MVELVKIFSVVCICADDWQSNSKSVGTYSGASSHEGVWRNDDYAFDELSHADRAWKACGCGESVRETIEEDIRTYKRKVEKMDEKVEKLVRNYM